MVTQTGCHRPRLYHGGRCLGAAEGTLTYCSCMQNSDCQDPKISTLLGWICATTSSHLVAKASTALLTGECINAPGVRCTTGAECGSSCVQNDTGNGDTIGIVRQTEGLW